MNNGFFFVYFDVKCGVRQGDLLFFYFFIIVLEMFVIYIRGSDEIKGINIWNEYEIKLIVFVDDMIIFLKDDQFVEKFLYVLNDFG